MLKESGVEVAILSARRSRAVEVRAAELGITLVRTRCRKQECRFREPDRRLCTSAAAADYMGDDWVDLPVLGAFAVSPRSCAAKRPELVREESPLTLRGLPAAEAPSRGLRADHRATDTLERLIARQLA